MCNDHKSEFSDPPTWFPLITSNYRVMFDLKVKVKEKEFAGLKKD